MQKITDEAIVEAFGSKKGLDDAIAAYQAARTAHAKTVDKPAPTAHPYVQIIVEQHGGLYEMVETPKEEPWVDTGRVQQDPAAEPAERPSVEKNRAARLYELNDIRYEHQMAGVTYKGHRINGDPLTLNALMATLLASEDEPNTLVRWKDAEGKHFEVERMDMLTMVKLIRKHTQACFDNEFVLINKLNAAKTIAAIEKVDLMVGWPA